MTAEPPADPRRADLVFEGGGVKGIAFAGALAALDEWGWTRAGVAGTSAGAITAALVAAGYTAAELDELLLRIPFQSFLDRRPLARVPLVGRPLNVLLRRGMYEGREFERWITGLLEAKGVTHFRQLVDPEATNPKHRFRLRVIASDLTERRLLVLPDDAVSLGIDPGDLAIATAVRMSMAIPFFFEPVVHRNPDTGVRHVIVDGGLLSNFPVWLFDRDAGEPRWPTFGLLLAEPEPALPIGHRIERDAPAGPPGSLLDHIQALAATAMEAHDRLYLEQATFARTIALPTLGVRTTEFEITPERARELRDAGQGATAEFLAGWSFGDYVAAYRRGRPQPRRRDLRAGDGRS